METPNVKGISMLLRDFFKDKYCPRKLFDKSVNTVRIYGVCISNFERTLGHSAQLEHLTDDNLIRHMSRMVADGRANATANRDRTCLLALWRYAIRLQLLSDWPDVPRRTEPLRTPRAWMHADVTKLLQTLGKLEGNMKGTSIPNALWWQGLIGVVLDTGERIGAVRVIQWNWIEGDELNVIGEVRKGGKRDKPYILSPETLGTLKRIRQVSTEKTLVFPWNFCETYLWTCYAKILKSAGLPAGRENKFHRLRKTVASVAHAAGLDAQELLDHQSRRTTQRYLDPRYQRTTQASQVLADWLRNPPAEAKRKQA